MHIKSPSITQVKKICSKFIKGDYSVRKQNRKGGDSVVFDIHSEDQDFVFRSNAIPPNYDIEHAILNLAQKNGVKVSEPVAENVNLNMYTITFSILKKLPGIELENLPLNNWPNILEEAGSELSKLYKLKIKGCGVVNSNHYHKTREIIGTSDSWKSVVQEYCSVKFTEIMKKIEKDKVDNFTNSKLTSEQRKKILYIYYNFDKIKSQLDSFEEFNQTSSILHGDLHPQHFIVNKGYLTGLIDFNRAIIGDPLFDIAYFSVMPHGELYKHILKTSGVQMDKKRFSLYRLLIATRKIYTRYIKFDYLDQYPEILDIVLEELDKIK